VRHEGNDPGWHPLKDERLAVEGKPLIGKWQVSSYGFGYTPTAFTTDKDLPCDKRSNLYDWLSKPITNPTTLSVVDKVNTYLRDTCDFHKFVDGLSIDRKNSVIDVSLGS
jgi:hypothetical protein